MKTKIIESLLKIGGILVLFGIIIMFIVSSIHFTTYYLIPGFVLSVMSVGALVAVLLFTVPILMVLFLLVSGRLSDFGLNGKMPVWLGIIFYGIFFPLISFEFFCAINSIFSFIPFVYDNGDMILDQTMYNDRVVCLVLISLILYCSILVVSLFFRVVKVIKSELS